MLTVEGEDMGNLCLPRQILKDLAISVQKCTGLQDHFSKPAEKEKVDGAAAVTFTYGSYL